MTIDLVAFFTGFRKFYLKFILNSGYRLAKHVTTELHTFGVLECSLYCLSNASICKSINYKARNHQQDSKNCQLNDATRATHPEDLQDDQNFDYYYQLEKVMFLLNIARFS